MTYLLKFSTSRVRRFGLALAAGTLATALHWMLYQWIGGRIPFLFFLPTILLTATSVGRGPALLVLLMGLVNSTYLFGGLQSLHPESWPDQLSMLAYVVVGAMLAGYGGRLQLITRQKSDYEQRLALVQTSTGVGLYEVEMERKTILASPPFWKLLGAPPRHGKVSIDEWFRYLDPEDVEKNGRVLTEKIAEGTINYEREDRAILDGGQIRWLLSRITIDRDNHGRAARVRGAMVDITERKQTNALLENTQRQLVQQVADLHRLHELSTGLVNIGDVPTQLQLILQTLADFHGAKRGIISLYDLTTATLNIHASFGFNSAELNQLKNMEVGDGACGRAYREKQRIVIPDIEADASSSVFRSMARALRFRAVHSTPLLSQTGAVMGVIAIHFPEPYQPNEREMRLADICARKVAVIVERSNAQTLAQESDQRFKVALESAAIPFGILTPVRGSHGQIMDFRWGYVNAAAAQILQCSAQELIGSHMQDVLPNIWQQPLVLANYTAVIEHTEVREFELHYKQENNVDGWFHVVASPMQGSVAAWFPEVSERKRQERLLYEADQRKDEFLATLAHELRNPLAPIRQAAVISKSPLATEAQKNWSHEVIARQIKHMALLLDDLLDISRITRGKLELRKQQTDLAPIIDAAVETARPLIDAKGHQLIFNLPPQPIALEVDPLRVAQVIANLLTNAAKYTNPNGTIQLDIRCNDTNLVIDVIDNGIGIRQEEMSSIFKMFSQVKSAQDRSEGGLGIGLALAKGLVELHHGHISGTSAGIGQGSRFTVQLPLQDAMTQHVTSTPTIEHIAVLSQLENSNSGTNRKLTNSNKILIADDNRDSAVSLAMLVEMEGHTVQLAHDGEEALAAFKVFRPDLVLLDIGMPKLSGYEVATKIRECTPGEAITLIAVTGWGQATDKHRALAAGFDHHITKPLDPQQLATLLKSIPSKISQSQ